MHKNGVMKQSNPDTGRNLEMIYCSQMQVGTHAHADTHSRLDSG